MIKPPFLFSAVTDRNTADGNLVMTGQELEIVQVVGAVDQHIIRAECFLFPDKALDPGALLSDESFQIFHGFKVFDTFERPENGIQRGHVYDHQISPLSFNLLYVFSNIRITVS